MHQCHVQFSSRWRWLLIWQRHWWVHGSTTQMSAVGRRLRWCLGQCDWYIHVANLSMWFQMSWWVHLCRSWYMKHTEKLGLIYASIALTKTSTRPSSNSRLSRWAMYSSMSLSDQSPPPSATRNNKAPVGIDRKQGFYLPNPLLHDF